jgi:hypothetical protein
MPPTDFRGSPTSSPPVHRHRHPTGKRRRHVPGRSFTTLYTAQSFLAAGDFNHDGKQDVAVTDLLSGLIYILLGNGDGTFKQVSQYVIQYAPGTFYVEDFDRDGNLDIVFAQGHPDALITLPYTQIVGVLFRKGDGTFAGAPAYLVPGGQPAW